MGIDQGINDKDARVSPEATVGRAIGPGKELKSEAGELSGTRAEEIRFSPGTRGWKEALPGVSAM